MHPDLRQDHDEQTTVKGGTLYRKGKIVQVWWDHLPGEEGRETWTSPDADNAAREYNNMKERWN